MISLLFVAVNSALLGRALFYSYKLFLDGLFFPEFPKHFSYYSFFILVPSLLFHNNAYFVSLAIVA